MNTYYFVNNYFLQTLLCFAITSNNLDGKFFGCGEVNLILILGNYFAISSNN